jgi:hypothetical protein
MEKAVDLIFPIVANMCNGCIEVKETIQFHGEAEYLFNTCKVHVRPIELPCVKNNEECPDYK